MASKTVVCPECGAAAAPGRYACADCGALLASVALTARARPPAPEPDGDGAAIDQAEPESPQDRRRVRGARAAGTAVAAEPAEPATVRAAPVAVEAAAAEPTVEDAGTSVSSLLETSVTEEPAGAPDVDAGDAASFDENAPLAAASRRASQPDVLHDLAEQDVVDPEPSPADSPSWPPPGDRGVRAAPEPRTLAGAYLPPSAVLPPLDAPLGLPTVRAAAVAGAAQAGSVAAEASSVAAATVATPGGLPSTTAPGEAATGRSNRGLAGFADLVGPVRITTSASRRAIAMGAGLASLGLVLPWVNTLPGGNPFAGYFDRWGLVGPGGWIPLAGLVALLLVAAGWGRVASWPIGLPAVAASAFVAGLLFRYVFGGFGWAIGIWFSVVGAIILLVGGLLDRSARHDRGDASVQGADSAGLRSDP